MTEALEGPLKFNIPKLSHHGRGYGLVSLTDALSALASWHRHILMKQGWDDRYVYQINNYYDEDQANRVVAGANQLLRGTGCPMFEPSDPPPKAIVDGILVCFRFGEKGADGSVTRVLVSARFRSNGTGDVVSHGPPDVGASMPNWTRGVEHVFQSTIDAIKSESVRLSHLAAELEQTLRLPTSEHLAG